MDPQSLGLQMSPSPRPLCGVRTARARRPAASPAKLFQRHPWNSVSFVRSKKWGASEGTVAHQRAATIPRNRVTGQRPGSLSPWSDSAGCLAPAPGWPWHSTAGRNPLTARGLQTLRSCRTAEEVAWFVRALLRYSLTETCSISDSAN